MFFPISFPAIGGICVLLCLVYADNMVKLLANSLAIVLTCLLSTIIFDFQADALFCLCVLLIVGSNIVYKMFPKDKKKMKVSTSLPE
jgi:uncharacterized membrane protein